MSTIEIDGQAIPLSSFNKFVIREGKTFLFNQELQLMIEFNVDDQEQIDRFKINEANVRLIKSQLEREKQQGTVPEEYKNKFCAMFGGKVLYRFDTREELEKFIEDGTCENLMMTYYYPANAN